MSNLIAIKEASELLQVSPDTIRRWDKKGLIKSKREKNNYRVFNADELKQVWSKINGKPTDNKYKVFKTKKKSGYKLVELFSGAGGTALGLENAGLEHVLLVEWDANAVSTLRNNRPKWNVIHDDIAKVNFEGIEADIVEGGFPCQAFSYAGKKQGFADTRGTMFFEFTKTVKVIKPKIAIGENVRGLLKHDNGRTLETMVRELNKIGYRVSYKVLRSQYLDVPQKRERLIILSTRKDLNIPFLFPKEKDYLVTLRDSLENVPLSKGYEYAEKKYKVMKQIPEGGYWRDLPVKLQKEYMGASFYHTGGRTGMARRLSWDEPSLTLTCNPAQKQTERCHPEETRPLNIREYARIQTFPDEWEFTGSIASQYKQIGNAVPVNLGYHIGRAIIAMLNDNYEVEEFEKGEEIFA